MKKAFLAVLIAVWSTTAYAQTGYTTVTGTIACYAGGSVQAKWVSGSMAPIQPNINGGPFTQQVPGNMNSSGAFTLRLADNNVVQPIPSTWTVTACAKGGSQPACTTVTALTITGGSQSITSSFSGVTCPGPAPGGAAGGDLGGTYPNPTVTQVNGAAVPASAAYLASNSSRQIVAAAAPLVQLTGTTTSIGGGALTAGQCATGSATVAGAVAGHTVNESPSDGSAVNALVVPSATVTSANTVTVQLCAVAAATPTAKTYTVTTY